MRILTRTMTLAMRAITSSLQRMKGKCFLRPLVLWMTHMANGAVVESAVAETIAATKVVMRIKVYVAHLVARVVSVAGVGKSAMVGRVARIAKADKADKVAKLAKLARVAKVAKGLGVTRAMRGRTVISSGSTHAVGRNKGRRVKPGNVRRAVSVVRRAKIEAAAAVVMLEASVAATPPMQAM